MRYLTGWRIQLAKHLILHAGLSIAEWLIGSGTNRKRHSPGIQTACRRAARSVARKLLSN